MPREEELEGVVSQPSVLQESNACQQPHSNGSCCVANHVIQYFTTNETYCRVIFSREGRLSFLCLILIMCLDVEMKRGQVFHMLEWSRPSCKDSMWRSNPQNSTIPLWNKSILTRLFIGMFLEVLVAYTHTYIPRRGRWMTKLLLPVQHPMPHHLNKEKITLPI